MNIAVLYHNDADGFGAAYACWKGFTEDAHYIPVQYGQPVPEIPDTVEVLYIVDFSYDRVTVLSLAERFGWDKIVILDHHKTAEKELEGLVFATFDQQKSGAVLAWEHVYPFVPVPEILRYVQDRDLWKFELPQSKEVNAYIATLPNDFYAWDGFDLNTAKNCGAAIIAFQGQQISRAMKNVRFEEIDGFTAPVLNLSDNISEVGNELCNVYPEAEKSPLEEKLALLISQHKQGIGNSFYGGMENLAHELVRENNILRQAMGNHADSYENGRKSAAEEIIQFIERRWETRCTFSKSYYEGKGIPSAKL